MQGTAPVETPPALPGYAVGRCLGRGGSATVWLVSDELTGQDFALKCFLPDAGQPDTAGAEESVRREIRILSVLEHQHLIRAHDVVRLTGAADGSLGLVMDYASGGSLGQLIASRGKISIGETVTVLTPISQVLGYLHSQGFTHSDVSPGNILFSGQGKPLLADVGVARMVGDAAGVSAHGTDGFMDPAPVDAVRAGLQPERDVFSIAAIGWYCLTGQAPVRVADRPPLSLLVPDVPAELAAALEAGLNEDRRLRPTAAELATAIYRSSSASPLDLSGSVHPTVVPELLTRRNSPRRSVARGRGRAYERARQRVSTWGRRLSTSRWSGHRVSGPADLAAIPAIPEAGTDPVRRRRVAVTRPRRRMWLTGALLGLVGTALACLWWLAGPPRPIAPVSGELNTTMAQETDSDKMPLEGIVPGNIRGKLLSADPLEAVHGLAWLRSAALSSGQLELLNEVNVAGSPAAATDSKISSRLQESGHMLAGFTTLLTGVERSPESTADRAVIKAISATSAYEERDSTGTVIASGPAGSELTLRLVLVPVSGTWRISEILPAD